MAILNMEFTFFLSAEYFFRLSEGGQTVAWDLHNGQDDCNYDAECECVLHRFAHIVIRSE